MQCFFVQIKSELGRTYEVAAALADREIASEIHSTSGTYDLLAKFYVSTSEDIGQFVAERVQTVSGVRDTFTIIAFRAF